MTDNYSVIETAIQAVLVALTTIFTTGNVTLGDYAPLDGGNDRVAVITPGAFSRERGTMTSNLYTWNFNIDIFQRYINSANTYTAFKVMRAAVINAFAGQLGIADVTVEGIAANGDPTMAIKTGTNIPTHMVQVLTITIQEFV